MPWGSISYLAAHKILPHGVNAISDLKIWGHLTGYGALGVGFLVTFIGAVGHHLSKKRQEKDLFVNGSYELYDCFQNTLKPNELVAIKCPYQPTVIVYFKEGDDFHIASDEINYANTTLERAYHDWSTKYSVFLEDKTFVDQQTLNQKNENLNGQITIL